jgi:hypothetical protein
MQLAVCWPGTHGSQPHAHDDDEKASAVGHQSSWPDAWRTYTTRCRYTHGFCCRLQSTRRSNATRTTPLTFVRSFVCARTLQSGSEP